MEPSAIFADNAKVLSKGRVTMPRQVRKVLNVHPGDNVTFVVDNGGVMVVNSAIYAMRLIQREMADMTMSEDEIQNLVDEERHGKRR